MSKKMHKTYTTYRTGGSRGRKNRRNRGLGAVKKKTIIIYKKYKWWNESERNRARTLVIH